MLATQMNGIVKSGQLQKGSIVQLTEFICNTIQSRRIIIIISLQILVEKMDIIGDPKKSYVGNPIQQNRATGPAQSCALNQTGLSIENVQTYGGSGTSGSVAGHQMLGEGSSFPKQESSVNKQSYGGSFTSGSVPGRNTSNQRFSGSSSGGFHPPGNSYGPPAQATYHQPPSVYTNRGYYAVERSYQVTCSPLKTCATKLGKREHVKGRLDFDNSDAFESSEIPCTVEALTSSHQRFR